LTAATRTAAAKLPPDPEYRAVGYKKPASLDLTTNLLSEAEINEFPDVAIDGKVRHRDGIVEFLRLILDKTDGRRAQKQWCSILYLLNQITPEGDDDVSQGAAKIQGSCASSARTVSNEGDSGPREPASTLTHAR
jgi:hypothetical protein